MDHRIRSFKEYFAPWNIELSAEAISHLNQGQIIQIVGAGWTIKVLFGEDSQGEFMDFYAGHRMTNDRHARVYVDGTHQGLPTFLDFRIFTGDSQEDERREQEYQSHNRKVMELLDEKGFGISGQEHPSFLVQKYQLGVFPKDEADSSDEEET